MDVYIYIYIILSPDHNNTQMCVRKIANPAQSTRVSQGFVFDQGGDWVDLDSYLTLGPLGPRYGRCNST